MQHKMLLKNYPFCRFSYLASFWNSLEDHSYVWKGHKIFYYYLLHRFPLFWILIIMWEYRYFNLLHFIFGIFQLFRFCQIVKSAVEIILLHFIFGIFQLSGWNFVRSRLQWTPGNSAHNRSHLWVISFYKSNCLLGA